jgi:EAL domain-containing protein (putative c-di-GMP-specific phosphodiesterase class I)
MNRLEEYYSPDKSGIEIPECYYRGNYAASFQDYKVYSAFQPIYNFSRGSKIGVEALARSIDSRSKDISPISLFSNLSNSDLVALEQILHRVHLDNFNRLALSDSLLFLNVNPATLGDVDSYIYHFRHMLALTFFPAERIVIEVLETAFDNDARLDHTIRRLKDLGCKIAIDDFGAGHSNLERVWRVEPDIVKIDRSMIIKAVKDPTNRIMLRTIVDFLHGKGCIVLAEGIETRAEAMTALEAEMDLAQGHMLAPPFHASEPSTHSQEFWDCLDQSRTSKPQTNNTIYTDQFNYFIRNVSASSEQHTNLG